MLNMRNANVEVTKAAEEYVCTDEKLSSHEWNGREIRSDKASTLQPGTRTFTYGLQ